MIYDSQPTAGGLFYTPGCGLEPQYPSLWEGCVLATLGPQERGGKARDFSRWKNDGALTSGPTWERASFRGASFDSVKLDGSNDHVMLNDPASLAPSAALTCSAWFNTADTAGYVIKKRTYGYGAIFTGGALSVFAWTAGPTILATAGVSGLNDSTWHHVAMRTNAVSLDWFVDGVLIETVTGGGGTLLYGAGSVAIGRDGNANADYLSGNIAGVHIWSRVLETSAITALASHPLAAYQLRSAIGRSFVSLATPFSVHSRRLLRTASQDLSHELIW